MSKMEKILTRTGVPQQRKDSADSRIIPFVISTGERDRHHTRTNMDNWKLDDYLKNPIVAYEHHVTGGLLKDPNPDYIIGKCIRLYYEGSGSNKKLCADIEFEDGSTNPLAEKIFQKLKLKTLSAVSVMFIEVGRGHYGDGDERYGFPNETYYFAGQELLEISVVNIPSNPSAGRRSTEKVYAASPEIQSYVYRSLRSYYPIATLENLTVSEADQLLDALDSPSLRGKPIESILHSLKKPEEPQTKPKVEISEQKSIEQTNEFKSKGTNNILITSKMKKVTIPDLIRTVLTKDEPDASQKKYLEVASKLNEEAGLGSTLTGVTIPILPDTQHSRAALQADDPGGVDAFPFLNPEDFAPIIPATGITVIQSSKPIKNLSVLSGNTGSWLGETSENDDASGVISKISFGAPRYSQSQPYSKQLLLQGGPVVNLLLKDQIGKALMNGVLSTLFGVAARTTTRPQGLGYACTSGETTAAAAVLPGLGTLYDLEKAVDDTGVPLGKCGYLTNMTGRRILMRAPAEVGQSGRYLMDNEGRVNGLPCYISNSVSKAAGSDLAGSLLIYGHAWENLVLAQVGTIMIELDPITRAKSNLVVVTMSIFIDWKSAQGTESTGEGTDAFEFKGFKAIAIK